MGAGGADFKTMVRQDQHYIVTFTDEELLEAQKIRAGEDQLPGQQRFDSPHRWIGKLGEWAFARAFPQMISITQHFNPTKHDFRGPEPNNFIYEIKTKGGENGFKENYEFDVNARQFEENPNDIYVGCWCSLKTFQVHIVGWLRKEDVKLLGTFLAKGEEFRPGIIVISDRWSVRYKEMESMHTLPI
jgi:hypothetical protein